MNNVANNIPSLADIQALRERRTAWLRDERERLLARVAEIEAEIGKCDDKAEIQVRGTIASAILDIYASEPNLSVTTVRERLRAQGLSCSRAYVYDVKSRAGLKHGRKYVTGVNGLVRSIYRQRPGISRVEVMEECLRRGFTNGTTIEQAIRRHDPAGKGSKP